MATDRSYVAENQAQLARLRALVDSLTDAELAQPMPAGWTVAGVLAHLAYWDQRIVVLMDRWGADGRGTPPPPIEEAAVAASTARPRPRRTSARRPPRTRCSPPTRRPAPRSACGAPSTAASTWTRSSGCAPGARRSGRARPYQPA